MTGPVATAARHLINAGCAGADLVAALADIEAACIALFGPAVMAELPQSYSVERKPRNTSTVRMRRKREKDRKIAAAAVTGDVTTVTSTAKVTSQASHVTETRHKASQSVTCDAPRAGTNTDSSLSFSEKPEKSVFVDPSSPREAPSQVTSRVTVTFEAFMSAYPGGEGMSRLKAKAAWDALSQADQVLAHEGLPAFRLWIGKQPANYTLLHAHNYLIERRFDGFAREAAKVAAVQQAQVFVRHDTPAWQAWEAYEARRGRKIPRHNGGWHFPSEFPPGDERQINMRLLRQVS